MSRASSIHPSPFRAVWRSRPMAMCCCGAAMIRKPSYLLYGAIALAACGSDAAKDSAEDSMDASLESDAGVLPDAGGTEDTTIGPPASAYVTPPENLAEWNLFADEATQTPGPRTIPYEVIAPLFSDYAAKR